MKPMTVKILLQLSIALNLGLACLLVSLSSTSYNKDALPIGNVSGRLRVVGSNGSVLELGELSGFGPRFGIQVVDPQGQPRFDTYLDGDMVRTVLRRADGEATVNLSVNKHGTVFTATSPNGKNGASFDLHEAVGEPEFGVRAAKDDVWKMVPLP